MFLIRNERTKLAATYLNGAAIASAAVGGISQVVTTGAPNVASVAGVAIWVVISLALHLAAQAVLGRLRE